MPICLRRSPSTVEIAGRCAFRPKTRAPILPRFTADASDEPSELRRQAEEGLTRRIAAHGVAPGRNEEEYRERLAFELGVIERMKYAGYFLIVADFIQWAKAQDIPVGPGRGSGAGSLVAYSLLITDLDPIRFGLIFERFLNPERVSMPDFDIDFCQDRRDEVIRYVQSKYGRDQVAQIITFGTLQARGVLRDVGRVLEMPYGQVDKLCKMVPQNPAQPVTLAAAIAGEPRLQAARDAEEVVERAFSVALKLEGLYRHASTHAAGIVIADRPLTELVPLYRDPKSELPATQFNMKWVEQAGLVKFDFLGLKTLTVLSTAVELVRQRGIEIDLSRIPLDDAKTYEHLRLGETVGIFQVESQGMRRALVDMQPDRFEDHHRAGRAVSAGPDGEYPDLLRAQARPGADRIPASKAAADIGSDIRRHHLSGTGDADRARSRGLFSLGDADLLRRAMGKKIRKEMEAHRERFISGAVERGIERWPSRSDLRSLRERSPTTASTRAMPRPYALRRLSDRISEGELSGRVSRGVDDAGYGQYRQAVGIQGGSRRGSASRSCRRRSIDPAQNSRCMTARSSMALRR